MKRAEATSRKKKGSSAKAQPASLVVDPKSPKSVMLGLVAVRSWWRLSQEGVSEKLGDVGGGRFRAGTSKWVVNRIETGKTSVGYDHMQAYAEVFGVAAGAFFAITHMVSRLRDGDSANLLKYADGLEELAALARQLEKDGAIPSEQAQTEAFWKFFEKWLEKGVDMTRQMPSGSPHV